MNKEPLLEVRAKIEANPNCFNAFVWNTVKEQCIAGMLTAGMSNPDKLSCSELACQILDIPYTNELFYPSQWRTGNPGIEASKELWAKAAVKAIDAFIEAYS